MLKKDYYEKLKEKHIKEYHDSVKRIREINKEAIRISDDNISRFYVSSSGFLLNLIDLEEKLCDQYFEERTVEQLLKENNDLYLEMMPGSNISSYANPVYTAKKFGRKLGQVLSYLYTQIRSCIELAYTHKVASILRVNQLFIKLYEEMSADEWSSDVLIKIIKRHSLAHMDESFEKYFFNTFSGENRQLTDIIMNSDLSDPRYMFKYGVYISENELKSHKFLSSYDEKKLDVLGETVAKAYVNGFIRDNKDISLRHNVRVVANVGQEHITKVILEKLNERNLNGFVSVINSTDYNKQFEFDHKFDIGLYLDEEFKTAKSEGLKKMAKVHEETLKDYSGIMYIEKFGEDPFSPENNDDRVKLNEEQQKFSQEMHINQSQVIEEYIPETERSFCIVAFPTPEIGDRFEDIFEDILAINMLDSDKYERIQKVIIDALDQGEFVHVKGRHGNKTNIMVKLGKLNDPSKETNFVNCVADVNIPVGEVFTSPTLTGTNGTLHVDTVYLDNFNYNNLTLEFKDGNIDTYTCTNFDDEEKNKEFVRENLMFPHKSLPIGEFAIGTNTLAYVISEKYGIVDKLPILIVEKMGPHFAVGDTCFSWGEDNPVFNSIDGKEIIARDNERSILRKEDVSKAYTNCHTDITIPYDSLDRIAVIKKDGTEIMIIKDGRFVLKGTEELNEPFGDM